MPPKTGRPALKGGRLRWVARPLLGALSLWVLSAGGSLFAAPRAPNTVVVFTAASMQNALLDIGRAVGKEKGIRVEWAFASSGALARKIEMGAPADAFVSADPRWMDYLRRKGRLASGTRRAIARNELVCVLPAASRLRIARPEDLGRAEKISTGDPAHVPAGRYAREALQTLGLWERLRGKLVLAQDARAALAYVERGVVAAGIVYRTDAALSRRVRTAFAFPAETHAPITYWAAAVAGRPNAGAAEALLRFLVTPAAEKILEKWGFFLPAGRRKPKGAP